MSYMSNESLEAIKLGLCPSDEDIIVAIGADQARMMLHSGSNVVAVDNETEQIIFLRETLSEYIPDRCQVVQTNLLKRNQIRRLITSHQANKLYLSNIFHYQRTISDGLVRTLFFEIGANLPVNGVVYVANHDEILKVWETGSYHQSDIVIKPLQRAPFLSNGLEVDVELSLKAREREHKWKPAVYRKIT